MPDVGVLQLTIKDNSESAAAGLDKLVSVLNRVKNAVGSGLNFNGYASGLKRLSQIVNQQINGTTITKISQLADSLQKLKNAGGSLSALGKLGKIESVATASEKVEALKENLEEIKKTGEIKIPVKAVIDDQKLKNIYLNEKGGLMGNTPDVPKLTAKYRSHPDKTFEDYYEGLRWGVDEAGNRYKYQTNDLISNWLHGEGTKSEQAYAIQQVSSALGMSIEEVKAKLAELNGVTQQYNDRTEEMKEKTEEASSSVRTLGDRLAELKKNASQGYFGKLVGQFGRLLKFRILRSIIRSISSGFSEGLQNVYQYSNAINGAFAPAMDSATSVLAQMKNSLGAALAPALQAIIPLVNQLVSAFINAINWANQLISLITGQATWTRAVPQTVKAFDKQKKAAKGAGAAIKDLLASWDELNIIQSESAGGGGSADAALDYLKMFEEVAKFDNEVKEIVNFIRDNFDNLKRAAIDIGAAILGWKVSSLFSGFIGTLGSLVSTAATIDFTLKLTDSFGKEFVKTGKPGWFIADALSGAIGATLAGDLAAKLAGGAWGSITTGFTLMLAGSVNLKNSRSAKAQSKIAESQMLAVLGSVEEGIGAALIAAGFTASTPVSLAIGGAVAVYSYVVNALAAVNITGIKWGENTLSAEEVQAFVTSEMLSVDVESQIKITHAAIELAEGEEAKLAEQATALLQPVNAIKLGVNIDESLTKIKNDVFGDGGLIEQFKSYTSAQKELVNTAETYVPTINANGENVGKEILQESDNAWSGLNKLMDDLGSDLSMHLTKAMDKTLSEELRKFELNAVTEITDTMVRVSLAGKKAAVGSDALSDLAFDLTNASQGTYADVLKVYEQYKERLTQENKEIKKAEASSFASAAAMYEEFAADRLRKTGGDETDELYLEYTSKAEHFASLVDGIMGNLAESVNASVEKAIEPGKSLVKESIKAMLAGAEEIKDGRVELFSEGLIKGLPTGWAGGLKENTALALQDLMFGGMNEGITSENEERLKGLYKNFLSAIIKDFMPNDYEMLQGMIDSDLLSFADLFDPEALFKNMESLQGYDTSFFKDMWDRLFGTDKPETPKLDNTALDESAKDAQSKVSGMVRGIKNAIASLEGLGFSFSTSTDEGKVTGSMRVRIPVATIPHAASGAIFKSGDIFSANENGDAEMIGKYGNRTAVVNNDQIINGITAGVERAITNLESRLGTIESTMIRMANKEWIAKAVPGSQWGQHNARSAEAFRRMTGE